MEMTVDPGVLPRQSRVMRLRTTADPPGDVDLVVAAQRGDRNAFGALYERYGAMVHGVLLARVPYDEVDDLVQDVFLAALERLGSLRRPAAFPAWLAAIARNRATDHHRLVQPLPLPDVAAAGGQGPDTEARAILAAVRTLPAAYRETLTLRLVEGMTGPEIAARTGLTPASVRVNLHRGMKQLREKLDQKRTAP
jgi:RNA polymerase sigma-70 factor (ECF subfamily)